MHYLCKCNIICLFFFLEICELKRNVNQLGDLKNIKVDLQKQVKGLKDKMSEIRDQLTSKFCSKNSLSSPLRAEINIEHNFNKQTTLTTTAMTNKDSNEEDNNLAADCKKGAIKNKISKEEVKSLFYLSEAFQPGEADTNSWTCLYVESIEIHYCSASAIKQLLWEKTIKLVVRGCRVVI